MRLRALSAALCSLLIVGGWAGCAHRRPRVLRLCQPARPALRGWDSVAVEWAKLTEERTNGRLLIQRLAPAGDAYAQLEAVREGTSADCALIPAPVLAEEDAAFHVLGLPWLFPDAETAGRVCEGPMGEATLQRLRNLGLVGLAYATDGFGQLATGDKVVRAPSDLEGLIIRVPPRPGYALQVDTLEALGAQPTRDPSAQADSRLLTSRDLVASGLREGGLTLWNAFYQPVVVAVNESAWEALPRLDRDLLRMSAQDAAETQRRFASEAEDRLAAGLAGEGGTVVRLRAADRQAFEQAAGSAVETWTRTIGPDLARRFRAEVERAR